MSIGALPLGEAAIAEQGDANAVKARPPRKRTVIASRDIVAQPEPR